MQKWLKHLVETQNSVWVKLSYTYTQEDLPVDSEKVARIGKMEKWGYPDRIKTGMNANDNTKVNLLVLIVSKF